MPIAVLVLLVSLPWLRLDVMERLELVFYDQLQSFFAAHAKPSGRDVVVVAVDEKSLKAFGSWPWPRSLHADLLNRLHDSGVRVVGFDVVFTDPDQNSFAHDRALATAMENAHVVLGWFPKRNLDNAEGDRGAISPSSRLKLEKKHADNFANLRNLSVLPEIGSSIRNIAGFEQVARGAGFVLYETAGDGIVRGLPLVLNSKQTLQPSFALEVARVYRGGEHVTLASSSFGMEGIRFTGGPFISTNEEGGILLRFRPFDRGRLISVVDVIEGNVNAEAFKDKIVLIGATASGLHDRVSTPLGEVVPGVMVHAYAVEQILDGRSAYRPGELHGIEIIVVALLGLILMIGFSMLAFKRSLAMFIVMEVGVLGAAVLLYNGSGVVMHPMYPALSLFFLYAVLVFIRADHMTRS